MEEGEKEKGGELPGEQQQQASIDRHVALSFSSFVTDVMCEAEAEAEALMMMLMWILMLI